MGRIAPAALALALLLTVLAGCGARHDAIKPFDGDAALGYATGLALNPDGTPRFRIPGSEGQRTGAAYLWNATDLPRWSHGFQNFTGADYLTLDRQAVLFYDDPRFCSDADKARRAELPFANLLAVKGGPPGSPVLMLGAHWDSQMNSNYDPVPARQSWPDPGANDGASGVGVLLQLMRDLDAAPDLPFTVAMLFIDGEDGFYNCYALAGSLYYAQRGEVLPDLFLLLDMVGDKDARYPRESNSMANAGHVVDWLWAKAAELGGAEHFIAMQNGIQDDHLSFLEEGVPAVDIIDAGRDGPSHSFPPQWDTTTDTVDKLDPAMLGLVGNLMLQSMHDPAFQGFVLGTSPVR